MFYEYRRSPGVSATIALVTLLFNAQACGAGINACALCISMDQYSETLVELAFRRGAVWKCGPSMPRFFVLAHFQSHLHTLTYLVPDRMKRCVS